MENLILQVLLISPITRVSTSSKVLDSRPPCPHNVEMYNASSWLILQSVGESQCEEVCAKRLEYNCIFYKPHCRACWLRGTTRNTKIRARWETSQFCYKQAATMGETEQRQKTAQVLFLPELNKYLHSPGQLYLKDGSVKMYSGLTFSYVSAIAYVSIPQRIWVAFFSEKKLNAYSLHNNIKHASLALRSNSLAVDQGRELVFLSALATGFGYTLQRMTAYGKNLTVIVKHTSRFMFIAVHERRKIIFACDYKKIISTTYDGNSKRVLVRGNFLNGLCVDPKHQRLYFIQHNKIKMISLRNKCAPCTSVLIHSFSKALKNILTFDDKLYVSLLRRTSIYVISGENLIDKKNISVYNYFYYDLLLCLIP